MMKLLIEITSENVKVRLCGKFGCALLSINLDIASPEISPQYCVGGKCGLQLHKLLNNAMTKMNFIFIFLKY